MSAKDNPAACRSGHERTGIVTNQNPDEPYDSAEPHMARSTCSRQECIDKAIKWVAGGTNRTAAYYDDAERRAARKAKGEKTTTSTSAGTPHYHTVVNGDFRSSINSTGPIHTHEVVEGKVGGSRGTGTDHTHEIPA
jgi:hypothetical protein